jgi:hypothetical protein
MTQSGVPSEPRHLDHYDDLARLWIGAELRSHSDNYKDLAFDGLLSVARDRCIQICRGEVRYSECGTGDLEVWHGRPRSPMWDKRIPPQKRESKRRPGVPRYVVAVDAGEPNRVWANFYDTFEFTGENRQEMSPSFFGNRNIGSAFLTNLQVAGQFASDGQFFGEMLYVIPKMRIPSEDHQVPWDDAIVEFSIGMKSLTVPMILSTAFVGYTAPFHIGPRQNFGGRLHLRRPCPGLRVRFHIEGIFERH